MAWSASGASVTAVVEGGQGWTQIGQLGLAFALASLIGLERNWRHKPIGLRTHTLVGFGSALFVIVSKYGFSDVLGSDVTLDPSRVAAQVVTGIGFIGGGLIFVRGDAVQGLTTAAIVWMTAAIGMACGAGLALVALFATAGHFVVVLVYPRLLVVLPHSRHVGFGLRVVYEDGRGILRTVLSECTRRGFAIVEVTTHQLEHDIRGASVVAVALELRGQPTIEPLAVAVSDLDGVLEVAATDHTRNGD
ncbi:MgtC/SapB family protein [Solirubrobacter ginsenosidimutans]|uniref:MgtC/SapB family protein n=1 Tax=Solirubrobacter ginsenosidimutans TaxID=490573 RepID=A0A9X3N440_9ACTN|nr:MgtC/SapB family protein [Solirubrobacter ginsenosidimutans]MDA0164438.1 MgtC/SapB family protein [Solirubrobacter ginsenosidimutans]